MKSEEHELNDIVLEVVGVSKSFTGVKALNNVSLQIQRGEIHALVGENGAGKSTLMKILSGAYKKDSGQIFIENEVVEIKTPKEAREKGIAIVYQELSQLNRLSVAENIFIGRYKKRFGLINWNLIYKEAEMLLHKLEINIDAYSPVYSLSIAQRQLIEIARAVSMDAKVVIMDEPTSSLTKQEVALLFKIIRELKRQGVSIIYISHKLDEVYELCDRVTVFRDGNLIKTSDIKSLSRQDLIQYMIGRKLQNQYPIRSSSIGDVRISVESISDGYFIDNVSFKVHKGEILGFAGLVGSGRTETMRLIFGADKKKNGKIYIDGKEIQVNCPRDAVENKIAYITEERKVDGLLLNESVRINTSLVSLWQFCKFGILKLKSEKEAVQKYIELLKIVTPSIERKVALLSGGNQQKTVLAKWLLSNAEIVIFDEPTRGIDVGAKYEIYSLIGELAKQGKSIIVVSSELEEVMGISDRIAVMREGKIAAFLTKESFSQATILTHAIGGF